MCIRPACPSTVHEFGTCTVRPARPTTAQLLHASLKSLWHKNNVESRLLAHGILGPMSQPSPPPPAANPTSTHTPHQDLCTHKYTYAKQLEVTTLSRASLKHNPITHPDQRLIKPLAAAPALVATTAVGANASCQLFPSYMLALLLPGVYSYLYFRRTCCTNSKMMHAGLVLPSVAFYFCTPGSPVTQLPR
eukprot:1138464-Pelagomonas_calceolata.AAC.3